MVDSFNTDFIFDAFDNFDREMRKVIKRHFLTLGKESFVIGIILIGAIFYFTFIFQIIPVIVVPIVAIFGLTLSIVQILRQTHALAIAGFCLNLFVLVFSVFAIVL